ncbi:MAG TPA: hypothetical protein VN030_03255 [Cellvibrio sp.]|nr:hypothetical protein [Cellvibrio sp.]
MNEIVLTSVIPADSDLERLHLFAGRHMGEEEFDRQQAYTDRRIAPLLTGYQAGIVQGLEVRTTDLGAAGDGFTVRPGLAVAGNGKTLGLYYPLRESWAQVIEDYLKQTHAESAEGIFYLTLNRSTRYVDADQSIHPEQRTEFDPTRDARLLVVGTLGLKRLAINASAVTANREWVENWVAANHVGLEFLTSWENSVPLGLLAIQNTAAAAQPPVYRVNWLSSAAGRYEAIQHSGYQVLLKQTREAFRRIRLAAANQTALSARDYLIANLRLDFLPAAGELPIELIENIASHTIAPGIGWLPAHIAVDMVPVPEEAVAALIDHHLPRRVVDLRQAVGDRLRLLLAVNEPDYKSTLLDIPQTDSQLISDLFRYFSRAYDQWAAWKNQFFYLYNVKDGEVLDGATVKSLDLPTPVAAPQLPQGFFAQVIDESRTEVGVDTGNNPLYPYSLGIPPFPPFYVQWAQPGSNPVVPKPVLSPAENGVVIQYSIARVDLESIDNQIRDLQSRVEKTRDYLMLQRQQLDSQTVSLSALAGGVAGDGSGLQVARWLPFTKLTAAKISTVPTPPAAPAFTAEVAAAAQPMALASAAPLQIMNMSGNSSIANTAQSLASVNKSANLVFASTLRQSPTVFSALQFNLNNQRLDRIAEIPKKVLTKPAFEAKEFRFGVLEHIRPETQEYKKAIRGINELITTIEGIFDKTEAATIRAQLLSYGRPLTYEEVEKAARDAHEEIAPRLYEAMFLAGKILTNQIAYMESRYVRIEADLEGKLRARLNKENEIEKLIALIRIGTEQLAVIDKRRIEYLGDYGVVQRLLDDDWLNVFRLDQERTRVLTKAVRGLYFIRVCQTPVGQPLADPLLLRYGKASDIVPGWDTSTDPDLPDDLDDFFETVLEVAIDDWAALRPFKIHIPAPDKLDYIDSIRKLRLQSKTLKQVAVAQQNNARSPLNVSLFGIRIQTQATLQMMAQAVMPIAEVSSKIRQQQAARVISLADALTGTRGVLQKNAQTLHNRLEQAVAGILEKLNDLAPSIRLQWAQLAEDDRLSVERVELWPGLERAEREDFNSTRTLSEIVAWWFRQLDSDASAAARSAMRNMIRATLIHASLGDPAEIIHGLVKVPPRRLLLGEGLRVQLNRAPRVGSVLQLLDPQERVIALLNVDDHDDKGTLVKISQVTQKEVLVTTQFRVVASKATGQLKR